MIKVREDFRGQHITAFSDGSYTNGIESYAFVLLTDHEVARGYGTCTLMPGAKNVSGELEGAYLACKTAQDYGAASITLYVDYVGVKHFALNEWKSRTPISEEYKRLMKELHIPIKFEIIKGHSGIEMNNLVDRLAKAACEM